jgi:AraC-like DNA-binding protein
MIDGPTVVPFRTGTPARSVGLRLNPGVASLVFGLPVAELGAQCVALTEVATGSVPRWLAKGWFDSAETAFPAVLAAAISGVDRDLARQRMVLIAHADSATPAVQAADALGWSDRCLRREVRTRFGFGYRTLVRIRRAQRATRALRAGHCPAAVAAETGYADQPHLTRELLALIGLTPGQLVPNKAKRSTELPSGSSTAA